MAYGLDQNGFEVKPYSVIVDDMQAYIRENFKHNYTVRPDTVDGMILLVCAFLISVIWQQLQAIYNAFVPSYADGIMLDNINEIRGIYRKGETATKVALTCYGVAGTVIPEESYVSHAITEYEFYTANTVEIPDSGNGYGEVLVDAYCTTKGAITAEVNTITVINSPISGWLTVKNLEDGETGRDIESDADFRTRANLELALSGKGTYDTIKSSISNIDGVVNNGVYIFENDDSVTDPNGRPAKSFEVVVQGGDSLTVAETILDQKPVGIQVYSTADIDTIPEMTSNILPNGIVNSSSNTTDHEAYKAVDNSTTTYWESTTASNEYIQYKFEEAKNILIFKVKATSTVNTAPASLVLKGSLNGTVYTTLYTSDTLTWTSGEEKTFNVPYYDDDYFYYKLEISSNNGGSTVQIADWKLLAYKKTITVQDSYGFDKTVSFTRPEEVPIYLTVDISKNQDAPDDYETLVKQNLVEAVNSLGIREDIIGTRLYSSIFNISGTAYAENIKIGTTSSPTNDIVVISDLQIGVLSLNRITITFI